MRLAPKEFQMLRNSCFYLRVARQRSARADAKALRRLLFRNAVVTDTVINNYARSFLRDDLARALRLTVVLSWHGLK